MYEVLNGFCFLFHTVFVLFILFGWVARKTRPWHLGACLLTAFSWGILGIRYGFGYCPFTDWHWHIREHLGYADMPRSYLKFLFDKITGLDANADLVDNTAVAAFAAATLLSLALNRHDWRRAKAGGGPGPRDTREQP
ncbi:MAG TPA: DUF2784 domain-containing protein [Candidatus Hydrogenedentes bacterium]|nr:DUF2784 domain-containing protein [Candidatus Hydrogenedentota bacterium]